MMPVVVSHAPGYKWASDRSRSGEIRRRRAFDPELCRLVAAHETSIGSPCWVTTATAQANLRLYVLANTEQFGIHRLEQLDGLSRLVVETYDTRYGLKILGPDGNLQQERLVPFVKDPDTFNMA